MKDNLLSNTQNGGSRLNKNATSLNCNILENQNVFDVDHFTDVHGVNTQISGSSAITANKTGFPDKLKKGIEDLSGYSMDDVKVHYNSHKPAQLQAHAYAQGTYIHLAPGQEKHLAHEAWHVVQQKDGRVKPTMRINHQVNVNDDAGLEKEADQMAAKALGNPGIADIQQRGTSSNSYVAQLCGHTINVDGVGHTLSELNYYSQELFYEADSEMLNNIWAQVLTLEKLDLEFEDAEHISAIKNKVHNAWEITNHANKAIAGWEEIYGEPGSGDSLHDLVYNVIVDAMADQSSISGMSYDKVFQYNAETQLAYCLEECRDDTEDVLALCLYTSYFYEPLNKYFRGLEDPDQSTKFGQLILKTAEILQNAYENEDTTEIEGRRYRLELKSGWINGNEDHLNFGALTSTHPDLDGVKGMWGDVANGTFGDYDQLALLAFEGTAKIKRPVKKYFPGESEDLMGPHARYQIIDKYTIVGNIPNIGLTQIRVFHLSNVQHPDQKVVKLKFTDVV